MSDQTGRNPVALALPPVGSVYGFKFRFGQQQLQYPHPGIVIMSKAGPRLGQQVVGVMALAISHAAQRLDWAALDTLPIPPDERALMGLDDKEQWVCLFEQGSFYFPDDVRQIRAANRAHLGQASPDFTAEVIEAWAEYRRR